MWGWCRGGGRNVDGRLVMPVIENRIQIQMFKLLQLNWTIPDLHFMLVMILIPYDMGHITYFGNPIRRISRNSQLAFLVDIDPTSKFFGIVFNGVSSVGGARLLPNGEKWCSRNFENEIIQWKTGLSVARNIVLGSKSTIINVVTTRNLLYSSSGPKKHVKMSSWNQWES